jgi:pilus assembly protein TadC
MAKVPIPQWAQSRPDAMSPKKRAMASVAAALGAAMVLGNLTPITLGISLLVAGVAWVALGRFEPAGARRTREEKLRELPEALDLLNVCLRAGQPLRIATVTVSSAMGAPISSLLDSVSHGISVGMSDERAWGALSSDPVLGVVAGDIARSATWGTSITDVLSQHSRDLRRAGIQKQVKAAKSAGVKSVLPLGLCYLPAFVLLGVVPVIAAGVTGILS